MIHHYTTETSCIKAATPGEALQLLKEGYDRFKGSRQQRPDLLQSAKAVSHNAAPFAAVLTCMDSRVVPAYIFDQEFGRIFTLRLAGNTAAQQVVGSLEYAVAVAGIQLIVVMGHTSCAAVKSACNYISMENLHAVLSDIQVCIAQELTETSNRDGNNASFVDKVAGLHAQYAARMLESRSSIIRRHVYDKTLQIVPAMYDVATASVTFYKAAH